MKSRLLVTMMLVFGLVLSTAGAGLAVSGSSDSGRAADVEYKQARGSAGTLGEVDAVAPSEDSDAVGAAPASDEPTAQAPRQVAATGGDDLPFTGFAAIPVLLGGLALLATGLVLRRRTAGER